jgi:hypothetical protein
MSYAEKKYPFPKDRSVQEICESAANAIQLKVISRVMPDIVERVRAGNCGAPWCKRQIEGFKDQLSVVEFFISGMCQTCQDESFREVNDG